MSNIFTALESVNDSVIEMESGNLAQDVFELMTMSDEVNEIEKDLDETFKLEEELKASVLSIEALIDTIEKHGICKSTILTADPDSEFRNRGILPAVDDVNDVPTNDEHAVSSVEGLKELAKKFWDAIVSFFKKIKDFILKMVGRITNVFKKVETVGAGCLKKLGDITDLDKEKLKKKEITYLSKDGIKAITDGKYVDTLKASVDDSAKLIDTMTKGVMSSDFSDTTGVEKDDKAEYEKVKKHLAGYRTIADKMVGIADDAEYKKITGVTYKKTEGKDGNQDTYNLEIDDKDTYYRKTEKNVKLSDISDKVSDYENLAKIVISIGLLSKQAVMYTKQVENFNKQIESVAKKSQEANKFQKKILAILKADFAATNRFATINMKCATSYAKLLLNAVIGAIACAK